MKKVYTRPMLKKLDLRPDEAVLAGCKQRRVCDKKARKIGS